MRTLTSSFVALVGIPLGLVCCGLDAVGSGSPPERAPALGTPRSDASAPSSSSSSSSEHDADVAIDGGSGDANAAPAPLTCRMAGAPCSATDPCCAGLKCKDDDGLARCGE